MSAESKPVVLLIGPTAAGKTDLAEALARRFPTQLVSVDSAQIYRGMDIGTAKPSTDSQRRFPISLLDIRDPWESYSVADFLQDVREPIQRAHASGRVPLLVGGTMMYFRALTEGLSELPATDPAVREALEGELDQRGLPALYQELEQHDPMTAERIDPADTQRILRSLAVLRQTGRPLSQLQTLVAPGAFDFSAMLLQVDRSELHERIEHRLEQMMDAGFAEEVRSLHSDPRIHAKLPSMRAVGYRQLWAWCEGRDELASARQKALFATRQLAKRQFTWMRKFSGERIRSDDIAGACRFFVRACGKKC